LPWNPHATSVLSEEYRKALAIAHADQPVSHRGRRRLGRSGRRRSITDTDALEASGDDLTIDRVTIADQVAWSFSPRKCIVDLSCDPLRWLRMCRKNGPYISNSLGRARIACSIGVKSR
jgi:hypothetical protein